MDLWQYLAIFALGILCGVINVLAGGGSNLVLPLLMLYGLPPSVANGTNRVGILLQNLVGVWAFQRHGRLPTADLPAIFAWVSGGGLLGALFAAELPEVLLKILLLGSMLTVSTVVLFLPNVILAGADERPRRVRQTPSAQLGLFLAGLYGGFVQAGVGFILITAIAGSLRYDLVATNALKLVGTIFFTVIALAIFIYHDQVNWPLGLSLAAGNMWGAHLGVKAALSIRPKTMKILLFAMTLVAVLSALINE